MNYVVLQIAVLLRAEIGSDAVQDGGQQVVFLQNAVVGYDDPFVFGVEGIQAAGLHDPDLGRGRHFERLGADLLRDGGVEAMGNVQAAASLALFGEIKDDNYYRAFPIVGR